MFRPRLFLSQVMRSSAFVGMLLRATWPGNEAVPMDILTEIIVLKLQRIAQRVHANHGASFEWDNATVEAVLDRCTEVDTGARAVDHILNGTLLPEIAQSVLARMAEGEKIERIKVSVGKNGAFRYKVN